MARSTARAAAMQLVYEKLMGGSGEDTLDALITVKNEDYLATARRAFAEGA